MVTISFQTIMTLVLTNWVSFTRGPDGVPDIKRPALLAESGPYLGLCVAALFVVAFFVWRLKMTRLGRAMQAVRDNELAANVVGVNAYMTKVVAFTLSALLGGFGGALFAGGFTYVSPDQFGFAESVVFLTMALLGGSAAPAGAILGTALLILLPEWLRFLKVIYLAVYGAAVILIMVFMPDGIWGYATNLWRRLRHDASGFRIDSAIRTRQRVPQEEGAAMMSMHGVSKHFGGLKAVSGVDLTIRPNTVHALIGPNGSGKTTLLNVLNGIIQPTAGTVVLDGINITRMAPYRRAGCGLGRTFQNIRLFGAMSILENVIVGAERPDNKVPPGGFARHALSALDFVGLATRADGERRQSELRPSAAGRNRAGAGRSAEAATSRRARSRPQSRREERSHRASQASQRARTYHFDHRS